MPGDPVREQIVQRVRSYVGQLLGNAAPESQPRPVHLSADVETHDGAIEQPEFRVRPERIAQAKWLVGENLITEAEAERLLRSANLPRDFEDRALARFPAAAATDNDGKVTSEVIIPGRPDETVDRPTRTYDGPYPPNLASGRMRHPAVELYVARTGKIFVGQKQTTLILDASTYHTALSRPASRWVAPLFANAPGEIKLSGTVAVLFANGATHFSHWMLDLLPKIEVLRRAGWSDSNIDYYVVNAFRTNFQKEAFERLGIPREKVVVAATTTVSADLLLMPGDVRVNFRTPPWISEFVRSLFLPEAGQAGRIGHRRLHVSRGHARYRRILNQDQIDPILQRFGFETVFAEQQTIAECAALFGEAAEIFAPHGAGAVNVMFAPPGVRLLESFSAHIAPEGWLLTHSLGGKHYIMVGHDGEGRFPWEGAYAGLSERERNHADYLLRPSDMEHALKVLTTR